MTEALLWLLIVVLCSAGAFVAGIAMGVRRRSEIAAVVRPLIEEPDEPDTPYQPGDRVCACGRKANPVKFHDGRYLCKRCKVKG